MACSDPKCPIKKEGERQIICWLCDSPFHVKCVGLLSRTTDQLMDGSLGLRWCCPRCRVIDIEFYKFFTGTHRELKEMQNDFASLFSKFRRFEELFSKFGLLDGLLDSKKLPGPISSREDKVVERGTEQVAVPVVNVDTAVDSRSVPTISRAGDLIQLSPNTLSSPLPPNVSAAPTLLSSSTSSKVFGPDNASASNVSAAPTLLSSSTSSKVSAPTSVSAPRGLVVVKPRKVIFVSRLSCDTSIDDITHFVKSKMNVPFEFGCYKMKPALNRSIASFKLFVPDDKFDIIADPAFWPQGIIVREFVFRENNRKRGVALPTAFSQKN